MKRDDVIERLAMQMAEADCDPDVAWTWEGDDLAGEQYRVAWRENAALALDRLVPYVAEWLDSKDRSNGRWAEAWREEMSA